MKIDSVPCTAGSFRPVLRYTLEVQNMPGRRWSGEEKANIVLEILTTNTPTAEICRRYNVRPTLVYSRKASFVQAGTRHLSKTSSKYVYYTLQ